MSNYNETDRMLLLNKVEASSIEPNYINPLTTIFYPDDQISSYQHTLSSTTPMPGKNSSTTALNAIQFFEIGEESSVNIVPTAITWHPSNHKRKYSSVYRNRNDIAIENDLQRKSIISTMTPQKRMFFPDEDFEYVDSYQNVNSIQDILNHNNNKNNIENENSSDEMHYITPSMPFSRRMKVEGIYRREKNKREHLSAMESGQSSLVYEENPQKQDPFSKFKPSKPGDVNLLAANIMKYKQYTYHKPRPLTTAMTMNNYYEDYYGSQDPNIIYHQIVAANAKNRDASLRNGRYEKPLQNNKPFSLMLDVYPMPEETGTGFDAAQATSTRVTPYNQYRRPFYPINSHAINHNLQYGKDNSFYNHLKFPQLQQQQQYPYQRTHYITKDGFYRNYITNRMNTNAYRSLLKPSSPLPIDLPTEKGPSQITVHLNLYPERKKYQTRNVEIIGTGTAATSEPVTDSSLLWKRLHQRENSTSDDSSEIRPSRKTYIPPFSAIKINALQHPFDLNETNSSQQIESSEQSATVSAEYDLVAFDSKKIIPNIKTMNILPSISSPFNEISPTTELPSTMSSHVDSTMSSSLYTSFTDDHFPFYSTSSPFETTAVTEVLNESESDQPTTIYNDNNMIRFPDH